MDPTFSDHCASQGQFDPLHAEALRLGDANSEETRHCRHEVKAWVSHQQESGIISRLFVACMQSLQCIAQAADPTTLPKRDLNALRRSVSTLLLWGDGYGVQTGALDTKLKRSRNLHRTTLSLLRSLCGILEHGLIEIVPHQPDGRKTLALRATCRGLYDETGRLLRHIKQKEHKKMSNGINTDDSNFSSDEESVNDTDEDSDNDADEEVHGSGDQTKLSWFTSFVADVFLYMSCLTDLGTALEFPALHHEHDIETEPAALYANQAVTETCAQTGDKSAEFTMSPLDDKFRDSSPSFTEATAMINGLSNPIDAAELEIAETQQTSVQPAVPVSKKSNDLQPMVPKSLIDYSYEETFVTLDTNGFFTVLDLEDEDSPWALWAPLSRPATPELSTSNNTPSTRQSDFSELESLQVDLDVICRDDRWISSIYNDQPQFDFNPGGNLQTFGIATPVMEYEKFTLGPSSLEAMGKKMGGDLADPEGHDDSPDHNLVLPHEAIRNNADVDNTFKCKANVCQYSVQGFSTQIELNAHIGMAHADNPLHVARESMTSLLGVDEKTSEPGTHATASTPTAKLASASTSTHLQQYSSDFARPTFPPFNPADQYPPCNTLYVGNLPIDVSEDELKALFSKQRGYKRLCFRTKQNGPMCFVEFEDTSLATKALTELHGCILRNSTEGGIRLSYSKSPLGLRSGSHASLTPKQLATEMLPRGILASYSIPHGTEVTSTEQWRHGGKSAVAVVHKGGYQKHEGTDSSSRYYN